LEIFERDSGVAVPRILDLDIGRVTGLAVSPVRDEVALTNHRNELLVGDLQTDELRLLDSTPYGPAADRRWFGSIAQPAWSHYGRWLAYRRGVSVHSTAIYLCRVETGETAAATVPVLHDVAPSFDPDGNYLYFLGYRDFDPVYDNMHFDLGFPRGMRP